MPTPYQRLYRGFTLIEILVVLSIVVLLLSLVTPRLDKVIDNARLQRTTRELMTKLSEARSNAVRMQKEVALSIDVEKKHLTLLEKKLKLDLPEGSRLTLFTANTEQLSETSGAFRFFSDGSSTGGRITLALGQLNNSIDINWLTGAISITGKTDED